VKENQPRLLADMQRIAETLSPSDRCEIVDKIAHGRQERRRVESFDIRDGTSATLGKEWDGLIDTVIRVTRLTWCKNAETGFWAPRDDVSYYACQIHLSAAAAAAAIRGHWRIESHHHVRDVTLCEDASRIRIAPLNFARLRSIALNILRANGIRNVARTLFRNALDTKSILSYELS
jgi:predicted transposase YbfD/YdcC